MSNKLKALILTPTVGGIALLVWLAVATSLTGTDTGTTLMKTLVPVAIGLGTVLTMLIEIFVF